MKNTMDFLQRLKASNNRDWFNAHKDEYHASKQEFEELMEQIAAHMKSHDSLDPKFPKIFRIYRDTRFSKDKTPYKTAWNAGIQREGAQQRGGYYLHITPGDSCLLGGFFGPTSQDLLHIRKHISQDPDRFAASFNTSDIRSYFGSLEGEMVKTAPRGFSKDDPAIDWLKHKSFLLRRAFSDRKVLSKDFPKEVSEGYHRMRPFFDYMSEILTHDLNGIPLI